MAQKAKSVADYLSKALDLSGLTQRELAEAVGYPKPNVISMMKLGQTKVPLDKIPAFAKALGVDPAFFIRMALREYLPEAWEAISASFGESLTEREKKFLEILREIDPNEEIQLDTARIVKVKDALREAAQAASS